MHTYTHKKHIIPTINCSKWFTMTEVNILQFSTILSWFYCPNSRMCGWLSKWLWKSRKGPSVSGIKKKKKSVFLGYEVPPHCFNFVSSLFVFVFFLSWDSSWGRLFVLLIVVSVLHWCCVLLLLLTDGHHLHCSCCC